MKIPVNHQYLFGLSMITHGPCRNKWKDREITVWGGGKKKKELCMRQNKAGDQLQR
jgi:hypothetical protein